MKMMKPLSFIASLNRFFPYLFIAAVFSLSACGGKVGGGGGGGDGGGEEPPPVEETDVFSSGALTGISDSAFVINGMRYFDNGALIYDGDGNRRSRSDLQLGMIIDIVSGEVTVDSEDFLQAQAKTITYRAEIAGRLESYSPGESLRAFGQTVRITSATVFPDNTSSPLREGDDVEIFGYYESAGKYVATRVNKPAEKFSLYKLRGPITELDLNQRTMTLGATVIDLGEVSSLPSSLQPGNYVKLILRTTQNNNGRWVATTVVEEGSNGTPVQEGLTTYLEGIVTNFQNTSSFSVNGIQVNAARATVPSAVAQGRKVRIAGQISAGVLVAATVILIDDTQNRYSLSGIVSRNNPVRDAFRLADILISHDGNVIYENGSAASLADSVTITVTGMLSDDHASLTAEKIRFD